MDDLNADQIAELKSKHGENLSAIEAVAAWLVFRKPTRHEYDRYTDKLAADSGSVRLAAWELAQSCIVSPGTQALTDAMDAEPALLLADVLPALNALAGDARAKRTLKL